MKKTLEERLLAVEDTFAITNLKAEYWHWCDGGLDRPSHNGKKVAALFVEDGVWEIQGMHKGIGQAAIRELFDGFFSKDIPFAFHLGGTPSIKVNGDMASGEWHLTALLTNKDQTDLLAAMLYKDEFVRTPQGWRIKSMVLTPVFITPFKEGWAKLEHLTKY